MAPEEGVPEFLDMDMKEIFTLKELLPVKSGKARGRNARAARKGQRREPVISVVIPAHNEEKYLGDTLEALRAQTYGAQEVVVVANGCTDGTADVARGRCDRLVVLSQKSLGVARNLGARIARGELLVFLDADTRLEPEALADISRQFTRQCAAGTIHGRPDTDRLIYKVLYFLKNLTHKTSIHQGSAGVILCWKEHFVALGGFRENLEVRENSDLIQRLKRFGRYRYVGETTATTSMRRYERRGAARTMWLWFKLWLVSLVRDLKDRKYETVR